MFQASKNIVPLTKIAPISASTVQSSSYIKVNKFQQYLAVVSVGVLGTSATVDAKIRQATDASGTSVKDVTGKAITQLVKATDDNKTVEIYFTTADLDTENSFEYVKLDITPAVAACLVSGVIFGVDAKYPDTPSSTLVKEIV